MKLRTSLILIVLFSTFVFQNVFSEEIILGNSSEEESGQPEPVLQKGKGVITRCSYKVGDSVCGTCYCLKASKGSTILFNGRKLRGCARLDISQIGDLSDFVDRVVLYEGTSDFDSTFICPQSFKLFKIDPIEEPTE